MSPHMQILVESESALDPKCAAVSMDNVASNERRAKIMPNPILFSIPGT